jgi:hypothetical protein
MTKSRLDNLSLAITEYGDLSIELARRVKDLGNAVIKALPDYLGGEARVLGVDPLDDNWKIADYHDQKFSTHGIGVLEVDTIQMGVAVCIPHIKDSGKHWTRVEVNFDPDNGDLSISIGDESSKFSVTDPYTQADVERICEAIYEYILALFADPVALATARSKGKIGFVQG